VTHRLAAVPPLVWILLLVLGCLAPFCTKPVFVDDTLFLRAAEQIRNHPTDFYGFKMNWFGESRPMIEVFDNPPLTCYYIALVAGVIGWSEAALHLAFLLPALAAAWGTYSLAATFCERPGLATVITVLTPVFLISATTLMADVLLLAFWVWALVFFEKGLRNGGLGNYLIAGLLAGLAVLTKFSGLGVMLLMAAWAITIRKPKSESKNQRLWWLAVLIPLLVGIAYELLTRKLYGQGQFLAAASFSSQVRSASQSTVIERTFLGLCFAGGCFLPVLFYAPVMWRARTLLWMPVVFAVALILHPHLTHFQRVTGGGVKLDWAAIVQTALFIVSGIHVAALAVADFWERLDSDKVGDKVKDKVKDKVGDEVGDEVAAMAVADFWESRDFRVVILLLWTAGILVFGALLNWTINGRSFLPMAPALGILAARRIQTKVQSPKSEVQSPSRMWPPALALFGGVLSLLLARADYNVAKEEQQAAREIYAAYQRPGRTIWFEGHWGFQYYMEKLGAKPLDLVAPGITPRDVLVIPNSSPNVARPDPKTASLIGSQAYLPNRFFSTVSASVGACFYAAGRGPLPYAAGPIKPDYYFVFKPTQSGNSQ